MWPISATHSSVTSVANTVDCVVSDALYSCSRDSGDGGDSDAAAVVVTVVVVVADGIDNDANYVSSFR